MRGNNKVGMLSTGRQLRKREDIVAKQVLTCVITMVLYLNVLTLSNKRRKTDPN